MRYRLIFCMVLICILSGCSKKEASDAYLSLGELLATERSGENASTTQTPPETTIDVPTQEETTTAWGTEEEESSFVDQVPMHTIEVSNEEASTVSGTIFPEPTNAQPVPNNYFYSGSYKTAANTLVFSPRELYYENGRLHATMYVYNGHNTPATNIHNIYLSFDNGITAIAEANFGTMVNCSIPPDSYVLWNFTFPKEGVYLDNSNLLNINTTYESTYNY